MRSKNVSEQSIDFSGKHANCKTCTRLFNKSMKPSDLRGVVEGNSIICLGIHQAMSTGAVVADSW